MVHNIDRGRVSAVVSRCGIALELSWQDHDAKVNALMGGSFGGMIVIESSCCHFLRLSCEYIVFLHL